MATLKKNGVPLTTTDKSDVIAGLGLSSVVTINPATGAARLNPPSYAWNAKPLANSVPVGTLISISNIPSSGAGTLFRSDGLNWINYGKSYISGASVASSQHTGSTSETTIAQFILPGGLLGSNGELEIDCMWSTNGGAQLKIARVYLGTQILHVVSPTNATYIGMSTRIANRNSQNTQIGMPAPLFGIPGSGTNSIATGTVDTSIDQVVSIRAQLAAGADWMVLERYSAYFVSK